MNISIHHRSEFNCIQEMYPCINGPCRIIEKVIIPPFTALTDEMICIDVSRFRPLPSPRDDDGFRQSIVAAQRIYIRTNNGLSSKATPKHKALVRSIDL